MCFFERVVCGSFKREREREACFFKEDNGVITPVLRGVIVTATFVLRGCGC